MRITGQPDCLRIAASGMAVMGSGRVAGSGLNGQGFRFDFVYHQAVKESWQLHERSSENSFQTTFASIKLESMPKMANTRYHHGNTVFVRRVKDFLIAHRACGVDDGFDALFGDDVHAVAEGEEGIGGGTRAV